MLHEQAARLREPDSAVAMQGLNGRAASVLQQPHATLPSHLQHILMHPTITLRGMPAANSSGALLRRTVPVGDSPRSPGTPSAACGPRNDDCTCCCNLHLLLHTLLAARINLLPDFHCSSAAASTPAATAPRSPAVMLT